ncbi:unnamed protein product [Staurois parvus]|uniref:Uncharacterized protein n=1 Tax=Staurois parvus TaxID=386267 RepID=A0ABN9CFK4_9NEOB|nr:unnamed protein product [Staurois parvus]
MVQEMTRDCGHGTGDDQRLWTRGRAGGYPNLTGTHSHCDCLGDLKRKLSSSSHPLPVVFLGHMTGPTEDYWAIHKV